MSVSFTLFASDKLGEYPSLVRPYLDYSEALYEAVQLEAAGYSVRLRLDEGALIGRTLSLLGEGEVLSWFDLDKKTARYAARGYNTHNITLGLGYGP